MAVILRGRARGASVGGGAAVAGVAGPSPTRPRWAWAVELDRRRPQVADAAGVALLAAASTPWMLRHPAEGSGAWACAAGLMVPLVWRRRRPEVVMVVVAAVALAQWVLAVPLVADLALLAALFTVASECPRRSAVVAWAVLEIGVVMASVRWSFTGSWVRSLVGLSGLAAAALLAGAVVRSRRAHVEELVRRAALLELERDQQAQIAAAAERTRIAREMHDVIAHSLAVMITMADGASAKLRRDPERAASAIDAVAEVGRQALGETRRLLGVLRDPAGDTELAPQPGLDRLDDLLAQVRATGLAATLEVVGTPYAVPTGAELAVYRIVQEATTNALKHAVSATALRVVLRYDPAALVVEVDDDGGPASGSGPHRPNPGGHGIEGMRERVALYGGRLEVGVGPRRGWSVRAVLPQGSEQPGGSDGRRRPGGWFPGARERATTP